MYYADVSKVINELHVLYCNVVMKNSVGIFPVHRKEYFKFTFATVVY